MSNKLHTHLHTHLRECDKGSVVGLSAGVEIRSCGNGAGGGVAAGVGAGGRVLELEETGGCSTACYAVTMNKIPSSLDFITPPLPKTVLIRNSRELACRGRITALQHSSFKPFDWHLRLGSKLVMMPNLPRMKMKMKDMRAYESPKRCLYFVIIFSLGDRLFLKTAEDAAHQADLDSVSCLRTSAIKKYIALL